jgi:hypothetical protein
MLLASRSRCAQIPVTLSLLGSYMDVMVRREKVYIRCHGLTLDHVANTWNGHDSTAEEM